jgi:hypothetical protein
MDMLTRAKGFVAGYALLIKGALILLAVGAVMWGIHLYNDRLREQGRVEVRAEWTVATKAQQDAFDKERRRLTDARNRLSTSFNDERSARLQTERQRETEREEAIRNSRVAGNVCFDERMRDQWNRDSGHAGAGASRPGVDAAVPRNPVEAGRTDGR